MISAQSLLRRSRNVAMIRSSSADRSEGISKRVKSPPRSGKAAVCRSSSCAISGRARKRQTHRCRHNPPMRFGRRQTETRPLADSAGARSTRRIHPKLLLRCNGCSNTAPVLHRLGGNAVVQKFTTACSQLELRQTPRVLRVFFLRSNFSATRCLGEGGNSTCDSGQHGNSPAHCWQGRCHLECWIAGCFAVRQAGRGYPALRASEGSAVSDVCRKRSIRSIASSIWARPVA